jgi:hypothetical protein
MKKNLELLRLLASEIRKTCSQNQLKNNMVMQYILQQNRNYKETSEVYCKDKEDLNYLAQNYACYLNSIRKYQEINAAYSGKGERSIKETANLVGFKLPHDPH